jgi:hypothetical protein
MKRHFVAVHESGFGTKRTFRECHSMSAFGGKADIAFARSGSAIPSKISYKICEGGVEVERSSDFGEGGS